jgi:NAD(P)H-hydrate epimerase
MVILDKNKNYISKTKYKNLEVNSIGIGPGIGTKKQTLEHLKYILSSYTFPIVLDADCINLISYNQYLIKKIPPNSILTPHPKELERLLGSFSDEWKRMKAIQDFTNQYKIYLILKGHYTSIFTPEKKVYFNSTGNPGMATGGSGDVLTGKLTSLLAQKYTPLEACLLGVFLHGLAGDLALQNQSVESLTPSDCIESIGKAFTSLKILE